MSLGFTVDPKYTLFQIILNRKSGNLFIAYDVDYDKWNLLNRTKGADSLLFQVKTEEAIEWMFENKFEDIAEELVFNSHMF